MPHGAPLYPSQAAGRAEVITHCGGKAPSVAFPLQPGRYANLLTLGVSITNPNRKRDSSPHAWLTGSSAVESAFLPSVLGCLQQCDGRSFPAVSFSTRVRSQINAA